MHTYFQGPPFRAVTPITRCKPHHAASDLRHTPSVTQNAQLSLSSPLRPLRKAKPVGSSDRRGIRDGNRTNRGISCEPIPAGGAGLRDGSDRSHGRFDDRISAARIANPNFHGPTRCQRQPALHPWRDNARLRAQPHRHGPDGWQPGVTCRQCRAESRPARRHEQRTYAHPGRDEADGRQAGHAAHR